MLFIIDMQNDFVDQQRGLMPVKGAEKLVEGIAGKIKEHEDKGDLIFYTIDIHENMDEDDRSDEEKKWGQDIVPALKDLLEKHHKIKKTYHAISPEDMVMIKDKYKDEDYEGDIVIAGVETQVCIISNAVVLRNAYPHAEIIIYERLCTSSDSSMHKNAIDMMKNLRMEVK